MEMSPPPPVVPRPYRRSTSDRIFGGVCGGLGRYWNVDPVILRVAFGVSLLFGGFGLFVYLALWLLVPDDLAPSNSRIIDSWGLRILGAIAAFIAAGIGLGLLFGQSNGGVLIGALLAGVIVWIVMSQRSSRPRVEPSVQPVPDVGYAYGGTGAYDTTAFPPAPMPPAPPRERSYLGLIGLCAAIAATGIALLLTDNPVTVMAAGLLALGVTLIVGAFRGRARWLLIFAVPLLMVIASAAQVQRVDITTGDVSWSPTGTSSYSLTAGSLDIDFADWQGQPSRADRVTVDMGLGDVSIAAPRNWEVRLMTEMRAGEILVDGRDRGGQTVGGQREIVIPPTTGTAEGTLIVDVSLQAGSIDVTTNAPAAGTTLQLAPSPAPESPRNNKTPKEKAA